MARTVSSPCCWKMGFMKSLKKQVGLIFIVLGLTLTPSMGKANLVDESPTTDAAIGIVMDMASKAGMNAASDSESPADVAQEALGEVKSSSDALTSEGRYIVRLKPGVSIEAIMRERVTPRGGKVNKRFDKLINGFAGELPEAAVNALKHDERVLAVMPDLAVQAFNQTMPTGVRRVFATSNLISNVNGSDERVNVDVAVLDSGVGPHADLNIAGGVDCTGSGSHSDPNGHGTHIAGTIGALDNDFGVVGVAPGVRIWSVRVLDVDGNGFASWILCGIEWVSARADTIKVANMSLGGRGLPDDNNCGFKNGDIIHQAICASVNRGITYVVAAGNANADAAGYFPASYDEVITVSALVDTDGKAGGLGPGTSFGADDTIASFSNYGADVDVIAPGTLIYSTAKGDSYAKMSGTSMASPHVAGAAALYLAANPSANPAAVRTALISTGSKTAWSGDKDDHKEPLIDVSSFRPRETFDRKVVSVAVPASVTQGSTATVTATIGNDGTVTETIPVTVIVSPDSFSQTKSVTITAGGTNTVSFAWPTSTSTAIGAHTFTVTVPTTNDSNPGNNSATATTKIQAAAASIWKVALPLVLHPE
jgi:subtilisin